MKTNERREQIIKILSSATSPISATTLAEEFSVSRQIIVGDIAILRAENYNIEAGARGYTLNNYNNFPFIGTVVCRHDEKKLKEELLTIVDFGGTCIDVTVDHSFYGDLTCKLNIESRYDVKMFIEKMSCADKPLSILSDGIHSHRIGCRSREIFRLIKNALEEQDIIYKEEL